MNLKYSNAVESMRRHSYPGRCELNTAEAAALSGCRGERKVGILLSTLRSTDTAEQTRLAAPAAENNEIEADMRH